MSFLSPQGNLSWWDLMMERQKRHTHGGVMGGQVTVIQA